MSSAEEAKEERKRSGASAEQRGKRGIRIKLEKNIRRKERREEPLPEADASERVLAQLRKKKPNKK